MKSSLKMLEKFIRSGKGDFIRDVPIELVTSINFETAASVSNVMVKPIIEVLGSDQQKDYWMKLFDSFRCIGCYAQTELGHGSDV